MISETWDQKFERICNVTVLTDDEIGAMDYHQGAMFHYRKKYAEELIAYMDQHPMTVRPMPPVHFAFTTSIKCRAFAREEEGKGFIAVSKGMMLHIRDIVHRMLAHPDAFPSIGNPYSESNEPALLPEVYKDYVDLWVEGIDPAIPRDPTRNLFAAIICSIATDFLFAHELAHIRFGHCAYKKSRSGSSAISETEFHRGKSGLDPLTEQTLEMDADGFALGKVMAAAYRKFHSMDSLNIVEQMHLRPLFQNERDAIYNVMVATCVLFRIFSQEIDNVEATFQETHPPFQLRHRIAWDLIAQVARQGKSEQMPTFGHWEVETSTALPEIFQKAFNDVQDAFSVITNKREIYPSVQIVALPETTAHIEAMLQHWKTLRPKLLPLSYGTLAD